ncbi:MAG TPA: PRD domain-containing protein [Propionicimonas sp.]|nr:PRD domain-containing protein [Propionicimonas sp.]
MKISKVFNNNVVLAVDESDAEAEVVLIGRGLGFGAKPGDHVDQTRIERTFAPGGRQTPESIAAFLDEIPLEDIALAEEIVARGRATFGDYVGSHVLLPLADHLSFALRRAREGVTIAYPLQWEVKALYPQEVAFSQDILELVAQRRGVRLPDLEAIPFALHLVNARFGQDDISATMEMTEAFAVVLDTVRTQLGIEIDEASLDASRFITHLRYLFLRQEKGPVPRGSSEQQALYEIVRATQPAEFACAQELRSVLEQRFDWRLDQNEILYLTLHIARLRAASGAGTTASRDSPAGEEPR